LVAKTRALNQSDGCVNAEDFRGREKMKTIEKIL
jgi:hypothetical protein